MAQQPAADKMSDEGDQPNFLHGQTSSFGVLSDDIQARMGFKATTDQYEDVTITNVFKGTAASDCDLKPGDHIVDAQVVGNGLNITIDRDGTLYQAHLRAKVVGANPVLQAQKPKMDNTPRKPFTLGAEQKVLSEQASIDDNKLVAEKGAKMDSLPRLASAADAKLFSLDAEQNARLLADYTMELIVDRSDSMHKPDCPGGLSRWEWCGAQAGQLAKSLAPYTPNGLTIVPFASEYDVYEHAFPDNIDRMFNSIILQNGTRLYEPLTERLDNYFAHRRADSKPLLIVIVTDGVPAPRFEPALVRKTLIEAGQKMKSPGEVVVLFCQIGSQDRYGQRYLVDLDQNLVSAGSKYHFVHAIPFDQLQDVGLGPSLVACIKQYAPAPVKVATPATAPNRVGSPARASTTASPASKIAPKTAKSSSPKTATQPAAVRGLQR